MINEYVIGKDVEGSSCDLIRGTVLIFMWRRYGNWQKSLGSLVSELRFEPETI
jgi:hypothetical protein